MIDHELLETIYGVPLGETQWSEILAWIVRKFGGDGGVLMTHRDARAAPSCQSLSGYDDSVWRLYADRYAAIDPLAERIRTGHLPSGRIRPDTDLLDPAAMRKTEFCNDFWRPLGIGHTASGLVLGGEGWRVLLTLTRNVRAGPYSERDLQSIQIYFGHLVRAFRLERALAQRQGAPDLDRFARGFGLTAAEARLVGYLAESGSLKMAAARLGRTHNTARAQLRAIFEKTGVHSQVELIRLVHRPLAGALPMAPRRGAAARHPQDALRNADAEATIELI